ncbi:MAG: hypothetical protein HY433_00870 [Candidatus Liptonbacteria bacterium]|nr:hypothetical protein [Candidatus Liptonbacteria bacterium]
MLASAASFPYWGQGGLVSCTGGTTGGTASNLPTCTSLCDLFKTGQNIIYFMMTLAVLAIAPIMIVIGGIMMLVSAGSETQVSSGRKMVTGAVIGIAIALGAFIIVNTFFYAVAIITNGSPRSWFDIQCSAPPGADFKSGGGEFRGSGASGGY